MIAANSTRSPHFFAHSRENRSVDEKTTPSDTVTPLGLKFAKEIKNLPHQSVTHSSTATNRPTPNGDNSGDIGYDVDF